MAIPDLIRDPAAGLIRAYFIALPQPPKKAMAIPDALPAHWH